MPIRKGFLRSETSLFQIVGRAARNVDGRAIMYADKITDSMKKVIEETERRREVQMAYNKKHGITPKTIKKELKPLVDPALVSAQKNKLLQRSRKSRAIRSDGKYSSR